MYVVKRKKCSLQVVLIDGRDVNMLWWLFQKGKHWIERAELETAQLRQVCKEEANRFISWRIHPKGNLTCKWFSHDEWCFTIFIMHIRTAKTCWQFILISIMIYFRMVHNYGRAENRIKAEIHGFKDMSSAKNKMIPLKSTHSIADFTVEVSRKI